MAEVLTISRVIDAPVAEVWRAWTDPKREALVGREYVPATIDLREGKYLISIRSPDGQRSYSGRAPKIVPLQRSGYGQLCRQYGNVVPGSYYGMGEFPIETHHRAVRGAADSRPGSPSRRTAA